MYFLIVIATTIVLPIGFAFIEAINLYGEFPPLPLLLGPLAKWYVLWAGGVRLVLAGLRQAFTPTYTLKQIFEIDHKPSEHIVQELGFTNLAMGVTCFFTVMNYSLLPAGALVAGLYYGLSGLQHLRKPGRNAQRTLAMLMDLLAFAVLAAFFVRVLLKL